LSLSQPGESSLGAEPAGNAHHSRGRSVVRLAVEVALISVGVFLGLMGEQWRERAQHRELAQSSLRRFRSEFQTNRTAVVAVRDHHLAGLSDIQAYLNANATARQQIDRPFDGTHPAFLEYTAWDVALATQSLAYVESDLAHAISHVYAVQRQLDGATQDITQVMYSKAGERNPESFLGSMAVYFGDCNLIEPRLIGLYDEILPRLDRALGEPHSAQKAAP
jgi:hypothetical protein